MNASIPYDSLQLTSIEGYFLSRIDGFSSVEDIASLSGLPYEQAIEVIKSLWDKKIFALDGVERDNEGAGYTALELNEDERYAIEKMATAVKGGTYYQILSLPLDVKPEQVKARFFELSKSFHPDRYFRKNIGRYGDMLTMIFKKISEAYDVLYDPRKKKWYDRELAKPGPAAPAPAENAGRRSGPGKQAPAADATEQRIAAIKVKLDADMPDQALKEMDALKNVRDPRIPLLMANYYLKVGDPLSAKDYVQMAIEFDGNNVGAYELLGAIYMRFKLYRNALKVYETIMNIDSNNTDAVKMIEQIKPLIED